MNKIVLNTIMNIIARIWSMVSIYIFVPQYIKLLGETSYGLVSFFTTLQTAFNILGLGLTNTLKREFAVGDSSQENKIRKYKLLRSIELIYFVISALIFLICFWGSGQIATNWLNIENLEPSTVSRVISLMGLSIAIQLVANLYSGGLFGINYQLLANNSCIIWSAAKYIGSLVLIWVVRPDLILFYGWHVVCDLVYCIFLRIKTIQKLGLERNTKKWIIKDIGCIRGVWKYTCGVLLISFIALVNRQFDKVIISNHLTITELGAYNVATTLGSLTSIIPTAIYISVFPVFTQYATMGEKDKLRNIFLDFSKVINIVLSCMIAFVSVFSETLIKVWTGSDNYSQILGPVSILVILSVGFVEYQELPYALAMAHGNTRYNVFVGGGSILVTILATFYGIKNYGLLGAGLVTMLLMFFQTIIYVFLVYRKYIYDRPYKIILLEIVIPLIISMVIAYMLKTIFGALELNAFIVAILAVVFGAITLIIELYVMGRREVKTTIQNLRKDC